MAYYAIFQDKMIFYPQSLAPEIRDKLAPAAFSFEVTDNETQKPITLHGWLHLGSVSRAQPLLIYYGGNGEEVSWNLWHWTQLSTSSFLLMNYRGFGDSEGEPGERALFEDALALFDHMVDEHRIPAEHIVLVGRSLGSGVAAYVASQRRVAGLVLVTPFDSLVAVGKRHLPFMPVDLLLKHRFDSVSRAPEIEAPVLAILAGQDQIVPPAHGQQLLRYWAGPKELVKLPGAGHNDITQYPEYWQAFNGFLAKLAKGEL